MGKFLLGLIIGITLAASANPERHTGWVTNTVSCMGLGCWKLFPDD